MHHIEDIYRILYVRGNSVKKAIKIIESEIPDSKHKSLILDFTKDTKRGIIKGYRA
jgi:UDP-N-acetylglucosamine acyltransferase